MPFLILLDFSFNISHVLTLNVSINLCLFQLNHNNMQIRRLYTGWNFFLNEH